MTSSTVAVPWPGAGTAGGRSHGSPSLPGVARPLRRRLDRELDGVGVRHSGDGACGGLQRGRARAERDDRDRPFVHSVSAHEP